MNSFYRALARGLVVGLMLVLHAALAASEPRFSTPARGDVLASGVVHEVRWTRICGEESDADEMELVLSVDGGLTFPVRLTAEMPPCSETFRWKVPALSSRYAVLAVRKGREGEPDAERVAFVSGEFQITTFETSPTSSLVRGPSEWWTEQALLEIGAENLLGDAMHGPPERMAVPAAETDFDAPPSGLRLTRDDSFRNRPEPGVEVVRCAGRPSLPRLASFLPLRV